MSMFNSRISRRALGAMALAGMAIRSAPAFAALGDPGDYTAYGHLKARIRAPGETFVDDPRTPGIRPLGIDKRRDAVLFTPSGLDFSRPVPLVIVLHGSAGVAFDGIKWFKAQSTARKFMVVAPVSRNQTWTVDDGPVGADQAFIDRTLDWVFQRFPIDPAHLAIAGLPTEAPTPCPRACRTARCSPTCWPSHRSTSWLPTQSASRGSSSRPAGRMTW
jgi:hypothetical protein